MTEAQAFSHWSPPTGPLGELVLSAARRADALREGTDELREKAASLPAGPSLRTALRGSTHVGVIGEIKRSSPSRGVINGGLNAADQALAYERGGAVGISVLTEPTRFGGTNDDLVAVLAAVSIPVLKKDFHVHPVQLYEARALGSTAALVIVRALPPARLAQMMDTGREIGLEILVEVRDSIELELALSIGADLIGVNNRDLETLAVDPATIARVGPLVPASCTTIAESGIATRADVERAAASGADAVLVGSVLSAASDPEGVIRTIAGVSRVRDARSN